MGSTEAPPERHAHSINQCNISETRTYNRSMRGNHLAYAATQGIESKVIEFFTCTVKKDHGDRAGVILLTVDQGLQGRPSHKGSVRQGRVSKGSVRQGSVRPGSVRQSSVRQSNMRLAIVRQRSVKKKKCEAG